MLKNWCAMFKVKVTVKADVIKNMAVFTDLLNC